MKNCLKTIPEEDSQSHAVKGRALQQESLIMIAKANCRLNLKSLINKGVEFLLRLVYSLVACNPSPRSA